MEENKLSRTDLEDSLDDTLYEIVVGGHICLIGKAGYIDWVCGGMSAENEVKNTTKL